MHFPNDRSGNQGWCSALHGVISSVAGRLCTSTKAKMLCSSTSVTNFQQIFPTSFSLLAVSCLEFLHTLDLPESYVVARSLYVHRRETCGHALSIRGFERLLGLGILHPSFGLRQGAEPHYIVIHESFGHKGIKRAWLRVFLPCT